MKRGPCPNPLNVEQVRTTLEKEAGTLHEHTPAHCEGRPTHSRNAHSHRRNLTASPYAHNTNTLPYNIHPQAAIDRASTRRNPVGPTGGVRAPSRGTGAYAILVVCY